MRTLARTARRPSDTGRFERTVFHTFENAGIRLREGTVSVIAGTPGSMKTGLALAWVLGLNKPTLYFSADSEDFEMVERVASNKTGHSMAQIRQNPSAYAEALADVPIRFTFEDSPTYSDVELEVAAYAEVHGHWPGVIVIDNLLNLVGENENEWGAHRDHMRVVHRLTRITRATTLLLAHMSDDKADPSGVPQGRTKLQGKVSHLPKMILSLAFDGQVLKASAVKNRFGPADASGQNYASLWVNPNTNQFFDSREAYMAGRAS